MVQKSLTNALQELTTFRVRGHRNSVEIVQKGLFVLEHKGGIKKLGDERMDGTIRHNVFRLTISFHLVWDFLEQLSTAAIDIGQLELANVRSRILRNAWNAHK